MSEERSKTFAREVLEFVLMLAVSFALVFGFVRPIVASPVFMD